MKIKYLFLSEGSYDSYWVSGMIFGAEENIEKIKFDLKFMDNILVDLRKKWELSYNFADRNDKEELKTYSSWQHMCNKCAKQIPIIAYKYDCTYVKMKNEFRFEGMDV